MQGGQAKGLIIGGALLAGSILGLTYFFNKQNKPSKTTPKNSPTVISKELLIKIINDLDENMLPIIQQIQSIAQTTIHETNGQITTEETRKIVFGKNFNIRKEISRVKQIVYEKYGLQEADYHLALDAQYQEDAEVRGLIQKSLFNMENALKGEVLEAKNDLPDMITPELVMSIMKKTKHRSLMEVHKKIQEKKIKGYSDIDIMIIDELNRQDNIMIEICMEEKINSFEEAPERIMARAIEKFSIETTDFQQRLNTLNTQSEEVYELLIQDTPDALSLIEALNKL